MILPCRDPQRGELVREELKARTGSDDVDVVPLDVANLDSVRSFVRQASALGRIDALLCNAGVQELALSHTALGLETTFATNHLGHFLLARGLLPTLAPHASVVFVSSDTHDPKNHTGLPEPVIDDVDDLAYGRTFQDEPAAIAGRRRYTTSKLCNVLCAYELERRLRAEGSSRSLRVYAFDPGLMPGTGLARGYGPVLRFAWKYVLPVVTLVHPNANTVCKSASRFAALVDEATAPPTGTYITRGRVARSSELSYDAALAARVWDASARLSELAAGLTKDEVRG